MATIVNTLKGILKEQGYKEFSKSITKPKIKIYTINSLCTKFGLGILNGMTNEELADDLLTEIMSQSAVFFENLVVDLMNSMNYGNGFVTKISGDDGIDGVIHEDKLGFNLIFIQAKRWAPNTTIGKPEIQKFAGAMMGPPKIEKGLFITTAKFSKGAREFADAQHIILVDGRKLTELMIEYNLGVSVQKIYSIKRIDSDYFLDN